MTPLVWMIGASVGSWLVIAALTRTFDPETALGMIGPLASACVTWVVTVRAQAVAPERVTQVMIAGLWVKMLLFGIYVIAVLQGLALRPKLFVASFAGYFIGLHLMEAFFLRRLFMDGSRAAPRV
jgi:hypothetical protein